MNTERRRQSDDEGVKRQNPVWLARLGLTEERFDTIKRGATIAALGLTVGGIVGAVLHLRPGEEIPPEGFVDPDDPQK